MLNPTSSQPDWLQTLRAGMQGVSEAGAALRDAPDQARRRKAQEEFQARLKGVEEQRKILAGLAWGDDKSAQASALGWLPIQAQQAKQVADLSNTGANEEARRQALLDRNRALLAQDATTNSGQVLQGTLRTVGDETRKGVQTQAEAYAQSIFPGVQKLTEMGIAGNEGIVKAFVGGPDGQSALQQVIAFQDRTNEINQQAFNRANPTWAPAADAGLRLAGVLGTFLV